MFLTSLAIVQKKKKMPNAWIKRMNKNTQMKKQVI